MTPDNPLAKLWAQQNVGGDTIPSPPFAPTVPTGSPTSAAENPLATLWKTPHQATMDLSGIAPVAAPGNPLASLWSQRGTESIIEPHPSTVADDEPWYSKSWEWLNHPFWNLHDTFQAESGWGQGLENVLSGFTSPLSIGLTVATFGAGPALRAAGFAAEELPVALRAIAGLAEAERPAALEALGFATEKMPALLQTLKLKELPVAVKGVKSLFDAGFTAMQVQGLVTQVPEVLDALKAGDYETAEKAGVEALASGVFAGLGTRAALKDIGQFAERKGWVKPAEELAAARKEWGTYQLETAQASQMSKTLEETARKELGDADPVTLGGITRWIEAGGDMELMAKRRRALAEGRLSLEEPEGGIVPTPAVPPITPAGGAAPAGPGAPTVVMVDPASFIKKVSAEESHISSKVVEDYRQQIRDNGGQLPSNLKIRTDEQGNVLDADGRHRALAAMQEGVKQVPVEVTREVAPRPETEQAVKISEYEKDANAAGVIFNGVQEPISNHPGLVTVTDPVTGTTLSIKTNEWSPEKLQEHITAAHKRFGLLPETPEEVVDHIQKGKDYAILSAEKTERAPEENAANTAKLKAEIERLGYKPLDTDGVYKGVKEKSFYVPGMTPEEVTQLGRDFGQESVISKEGLHTLADDSVAPPKGEVIQGESAAQQEGHSVIHLPDGKEITIHTPFDFENVKRPTPLESTFAEIPGEKSTSDLLVEKYGVTTDPLKAGFILSDGRMVPLTGEHDLMINSAWGKVGALSAPAREEFIEGEKAIRTRFRKSKRGDEVVFSVPKAGVSLEQIEQMKKSIAAIGREGNVVMEIAEGKGQSATKEFATAADIEPMLREIGAYPEPKRAPVVPLEEAKVPTPVVAAAMPKEPAPAPTSEPVPAVAPIDKTHSGREKAELLAKYDRGMHLSPKELGVAQKIRQGLDDDLEISYQNGLIRTAVENYISHFWKPEEKNAAIDTLRYQIHGGAFDTNVLFAKRRIFGSSFDGEMLGRKLHNDDPIALAANYRYQTQKAMAARRFLERCMDKDIRGSDGRPLAVISGTGKQLGEESENPAIGINPKAMRRIQIAEAKIQDMQKTGEFQRFLASGILTKLGERVAKDGTKTPYYGWNTGDYGLIDHHAFRDWTYVSDDTGGAPIYMKGEIRTHPEATEFIRRAVGAEKSPIRQYALGRGALKAGGEAKHLLLSLSPFHIVQEGLRGTMIGINPFGTMKFDLLTDTVLQKCVQEGAVLTKDFRGIDDYTTEGLGGNSIIINQIPGLRNLQNGMQKFLFDDYIYGLKARALKSLVERYREAGSPNPFREAAENTNEVFGGLNYAMLGRSLATQDLLRLTVLAPDWLESEIRFLKRVLGGSGAVGQKIALQDTARIAAYTFAAARVLNLIVSGKPHLEAPFGVVKEGEKGQPDSVFSFRTLPTDLVHAVSDPMNFMHGRVNPLTVRTAMELFQGRDAFGRKVTPADEFGDMVKNIAPIATQGQLKRLFGQVPDLSNPEQVAKAAGMSVYHYRTEAEKLCQELASDRIPTGPVDPAQRAKHLRNMQLEDALRNGDITRGQIMQQLPAHEAKKIIQDSTLSPLQARFERLPLFDALHVFEIATPPEKEQLHVMLWNKRKAWMKQHQNIAEREGDRTWIKMQQIYPDLQKLQEGR